jgi:hypothetical protein
VGGHLVEIGEPWAQLPLDRRREEATRVGGLTRLARSPPEAGTSFTCQSPVRLFLPGLLVPRRDVNEKPGRTGFWLFLFRFQGAIRDQSDTYPRVGALGKEPSARGRGETLASLRQA